MLLAHFIINDSFPVLFTSYIECYVNQQYLKRDPKSPLFLDVFCFYINIHQDIHSDDDMDNNPHAGMDNDGGDMDNNSLGMDNDGDDMDNNSPGMDDDKGIVFPCVRPPFPLKFLIKICVQYLKRNKINTYLR